MSSDNVDAMLSVTVL